MFEHKGVDVRVEGLSKRYKMAAEEVHALHESSWEVRKGAAVAIMGPSGCGKTTLLNLLGGVDRPSTGRILIDGQDLTGMSEQFSPLFSQADGLLAVGCRFSQLTTGSWTLPVPASPSAGLPPTACLPQCRLNDPSVRQPDAWPASGSAPPAGSTTTGALSFIRKVWRRPGGYPSTPRISRPSN